MRLTVQTVRTPLLALLLALCLLPFYAVITPRSTLADPSHEVAAEAAVAPPTGQFVPGEVLVKPRAGVSESALSRLVDYPIAPQSSIDPLEVLQLQVPAGRELETVRRLRDSPLVEWAEPNYLRATLAVPNDQLYRQFQWNLRKIQAEQAWDITTGSPDVVVAVLDTGIDSSHPDLAGKLVPGYDFLNDTPNPADDSGHGTHKAGVIGAVTNNGAGVAGISWGARIMPVKVLNSGGTGPDSVIARGIAYAVDHGARVINMSFGSSTTSRILASAVSYATNKGALLVAAAGNTAKSDNAEIYPAAYDQVLAVAATDENDKVADFSQHHPYVGVSAPGVHIVSTFWRGAGYGSYVSSSGTSDAAPHVSGLAALIWSANPSLSNVQVRRIIQDTADDLGPPGKDDYYGTGRNNAFKALSAAQPAAHPTATIPPTPIAPAATPIPAPEPAPATLPKTVWYFAEGSTFRPFDLWLLLQNPNMAAATAKVTYMKGDGSQQSQEMWLPPLSRKSIFVNQVVPNADVSMKVESASQLFAERAMYFGRDGHDSVGVSAPSTRWYLAEGNTKEGFDTWLLLQNPLAVPANVNITFLTADGQRKEFATLLPPTSRRSVYVNQMVPDAEVSAVLSSDQPIVAERSMYFRQGGGHNSVAASQLARSWYLAEGVVGNGFDTWMLVLNPNPAVANLKATFMMEDGTTSTGYFAVQPSSRLSVYLNEVVPAGRFGTQVESDQPIVVERSTYFADGNAGQNVVATPLLVRDWYLPEGSTKAPFSQVIAVLNPNDRAANLMVTFMKIDGTTETRDFTMKPTSRLTLNVNELLPDTEASTRVSADLPIAVERSMFFSGGLGGTSSFGIPR